MRSGAVDHDDGAAVVCLFRRRPALGDFEVGAPDRIWVRADEHSELHQPSLHGCVGAWGARQEASSAGSFFGHDVVRIGEVAVAQ